MTDSKRYDQPDAYRTRTRARISAVDQLEYFLRSRASKVVVLALVANTMVAQLLYNSAGQLVIGNQVLLGYLIVSAISESAAWTRSRTSRQIACCHSGRASM